MGESIEGIDGEKSLGTKGNKRGKRVNLYFNKSPQAKRLLIKEAPSLRTGKSLDLLKKGM
jgi:hypothetical protein